MTDIVEFNVSTINSSWIWAANYSVCKSNGPIIKFIKEYLTNKNVPCGFTIETSDGIINEESYKSMDSKLKTENKHIIGVLCSRGVQHSNILYLPLDDDTFEYGLDYSIGYSYHAFKKWEERLPSMFWRGRSCSSDISIRHVFMKKYYNHPYTDIKFINAVGSRNASYPDSAYTSFSTLVTHYDCKYILSIDGNVIPSSFQWIFRSGSVPILLTHPDNNFWFKKYLKPMVNYVPLKYDLSDFEEKIEWLRANDDLAKNIMEEAMKLSKEIFTSEFQKKYVSDELDRILESS